MRYENFDTSHELKTALIAAPALIVSVLGYAAYVGANKSANAISSGIEIVRNAVAAHSDDQHAIYAADGGVAPGALRQSGEV